MPAVRRWRSSTCCSAGYRPWTAAGWHVTRSLPGYQVAEEESRRKRRRNTHPSAPRNTRTSAATTGQRQGVCPDRLTPAARLDGPFRGFPGAAKPPEGRGVGAVAVVLEPRTGGTVLALRTGGRQGAVPHGVGGSVPHGFGPQGPSVGGEELQVVTPQGPWTGAVQGRVPQAP